MDILSDLSLAGRLWRGQDKGIVRRCFGGDHFLDEKFTSADLIRLFGILETLFVTENLHQISWIDHFPGSGKDNVCSFSNLSMLLQVSVPWFWC